MSVSTANSTPAASSSARSSAKFSMMPLCTTAIRPAGSMCGCALRSFGRAVGGPAGVPDAGVPGTGPASASSASRFSIRPAFFATAQPPVVGDHRHPGGVVAAVLQPAQALHRPRPAPAGDRRSRRCRTCARGYGSVKPAGSAAAGRCASRAARPTGVPRRRLPIGAASVGDGSRSATGVYRITVAGAGRWAGRCTARRRCVDGPCSTGRCSMAGVAGRARRRSRRWPAPGCVLVFRAGAGAAEQAGAGALLAARRWRPAVARSAARSR